MQLLRSTVSLQLMETDEQGLVLLKHPCHPRGLNLEVYTYHSSRIGAAMSALQEYHPLPLKKWAAGIRQPTNATSDLNPKTLKGQETSLI